MTIIAQSIFRATMLLIVLLAVSPACWSLDKSEDIDTNRPSFMYSPLVVPRASVQFENGTLFSLLNGRRWIYDVPETQVRVGLTKRTEFQAFTPNWFLLRVNDPNPDTISRVSDIQEIGIKQQIGPLFTDEKKSPRILRNLNVSIVGGVTPPTGSRLVSAPGTIGSVRIPWGKSIGKNYALMGMQSLLFNGHNVQWQPDFMFERNFGPRTTVFVEYGGFFTTGKFPLNIAHFGAVRKLSRNQQIDFQMGFGMNATAPIAFFGGGYSFRFDRLKW